MGTDPGMLETIEYRREGVFYIVKTATIPGSLLLEVLDSWTEERQNRSPED